MSFHQYRINELYSSADGNVQFIEMRVGNFDGESFWQGVALTSSSGGVTHTFHFPRDLPSEATANTTVLIATQAFADLGIVSPDFIVPVGFLFAGGGKLNYGGVDVVDYTALPTDGASSLDAAGTLGIASPTNFSGLVGHLQATVVKSTISGTAGNDVLSSRQGNDTIDGGAGLDVAVYSGSSGNYQLGFSNGAWTVQDKTGVDGTDTVTNVERLQFANKTVITDFTAPGSYADLPESLWHFCIVAFSAAPGVEYMNQMGDAYRSGFSVQTIVDIFTSKSQFTDVYATNLSHVDMATALVNNVVKSSASTVVKQGAINDIVGALDLGWTVGKMIYTVFGNLAGKPLDDPTWGNTAHQFQNEIAVAKYYTNIMDQSTTDLSTLRQVLAPVNQSTDVSTPEHIATLIGVALMT